MLDATPLVRRRDWETASSLRARTVDLPANAPVVIQLQHPDGSVEMLDLILCQPTGKGANLQLLMRVATRRATMAAAKGTEAAELLRSHM